MTGCSLKENCRGRRQQPGMNDNRRLIDGMMERVKGVTMTSEVDDDQAGQQCEPADSGTVERHHATHQTPSRPP